MEDRLDALLAPLIKKAVLLTPHADPKAWVPLPVSKLGGLPYFEAGATWPVCKLCTQPLTFVFQLFDETTSALLVFHYCFDCLPAGDDPRDRGLWHAQWFTAPQGYKQIRLAPPGADRNAITPCRITHQTVRSLPGWEGLDTQSPEAEGLCCELDPESPWQAFDQAVTRAGCIDDLKSWQGGYPLYLQGEHVPDCPHCQASMTFFAQIDSEGEANLDWGAVGLIYLFYCAQHPQSVEFVRQNT
ncbi:DUF1963 domain-containing protein [Halomonas sp. PAMB 3264]|uniref:DUF1963 domain-containing protein n=1 Tax=Halomonas sp. PAMB 3264 TaxID=3075222 RepID=UPI00289E4217|nr:DUF1963 domain-containing protein [Halomonas sp. PAMB 3264]WNL43253.1 DUF1963 domain-containing protein [Halomonas sp. PAMB 3264]